MTAHFETGDPQVQLLPDGRLVRLLTEIRFLDSLGTLWVAPIGLVSDGASIPVIFWPEIGGPFEGKYRAPALLHDAAYAAAPAFETPILVAERSAKRAAADRMLFEASLVAGTPMWKARAMHDALRLAGGRVWAAHAKENALRAA